MESLSLTEVADEQLAAARAARSGRAAHTLHGGHDHMLRQTVIALVAGQELAELQVFRGRVRVSTAAEEWSGAVGDFLVLPAERHALHADDDAVVLLTVLADSRSAK